MLRSLVTPLTLCAGAVIGVAGLTATASARAAVAPPVEPPVAAEVQSMPGGFDSIQPHRRGFSDERGRPSRDPAPQPKRVYWKLAAKNRAHAVALGVRTGLLQLATV